MQLITALIGAVIGLHANAQVEVVHLQVGPCLRDTCVRKVNLATSQAKSGMPTGGTIEVVSIDHGLGRYKPNGVVDLPDLNKKMGRAGLKLFAVMLEVKDLAKAREQTRLELNEQRCGRDALPKPWQTVTTNTTRYLWKPSGEVCVVR